MIRLLSQKVRGILRRWPQTSIVCLLWVAFLMLVWPNILQQNNKGVFAGHPFVWADWSWHLSQAQWFASQPLSHWLSCFPIYACVKLNYPFLTNLISGILLKLQLPLTVSFLVPSFLESLFVIYMTAKIYKTILRKDLLTALAILLFIGSGGLGFLLYVHSLMNGSPFTVHLWTPFTQLSEQGIEFINITLGMLIPQRAFLLGLGIALLALLQVWKMYSNESVKRSSIFIFTACMVVLPISHAHSFIIVLWVTAFLALMNILSSSSISIAATKFIRWIKFAFPGFCISGIMYLVFLRSTAATEQFYSFKLGWMAPPGLWNWCLFWLKNWGFFGVLSVIGTYGLYQKDKRLFMWTISWWSIFAAGNLVQFQPQIWDNSKFFAWAYIGLAPAAAYAINMIRKIPKAGGSVAGLFFLCAILSGLVDLYNLTQFDSMRVQMFTQPQIELAKFVKQKISKDSIFLTSEYPTNPITALSGRAVVLGYSGWIFSYGLPYLERQADVQQLYSEPQNNLSKFQKYNIHYALVGENELSLRPNEEYFTSHFPKVFTNEAGTIYDVSLSR